MFLFFSDRGGKQGGESIGGKEGDVAEEAFMRVWLIAGKHRCHIFYSQRVIDVKDGLPKWDGMNEKSELIGETGGQESGAGNDGVKTKEKRKLEMELEEEEMDQRAKKSLRGGREH